jgi:cell division protein FtsI (penicillin-binding protein 3)
MSRWSIASTVLGGFTGQRAPSEAKPSRSRPVALAEHAGAESRANQSRRAFDITAVALAGAMCLTMVVVLGRVAQLQLAPSDQLREHMDARTTYRTVLPVRGDIKDRRDRVLAATRFGWRVVVDPTIFPSPPDTAIVSLAQALDLPAEKVGERVLRALVENERRTEARGGAALRADADSPAARLATLLNQRVDTVVARVRSGDSLAPEADDPASPGLAGEPVGEQLATAPGVTPFVDGASVQAGESRANADGTANPTAANPTAASTTPRGPIRYLPIGGVIEDDAAQRVRALKITGVALERRQIREYPAGPSVASIVGKVGFEHQGLLGAELALNEPLTGEKGRVGYLRDSRGRPLWTSPGQVILPASGQDVRLSIDLEIQRIATEELQRGIEEADAVGGRLVMIDPRTGEILAMVDLVRDLPDLVPYPWADKPVRVRGQPTPPVASLPTTRQRYVTLVADKGRAVHPAMARNRCVEDVYEPGSTFKPFVWATITELGLAHPNEVFDTEGGRWRTFYGRPIQDVTRRATMTWAEVLVNSSNIGMIKAAERMTHQQLRDAVLRFGFGRATGLSLPGEADGLVTPATAWGKYSQTSVAYGHEIAVTPVQMVRAFAAFARNGDDAGTMPQLRLSGATDPEATDLTRGVVIRVLPADVAMLTRNTMTAVATNMEGRWAKPPEGGWRYTLFGKSGTAEIPLGPPPKGKVRPRDASGYFDDQYNSSFVAGAPLDDPRVVIIVVIDDPGPSRVFSSPRSHYGAAVAGPVVRRTVERTLAYLGVPPSPTVDASGASAAPVAPATRPAVAPAGRPSGGPASGPASRPAGGPSTTPAGARPSGRGNATR